MARKTTSKQPSVDPTKGNAAAQPGKAPKASKTSIPAPLQEELIAASVEQARCQKAYDDAHTEASKRKEALAAATQRIMELLKEARTGQPRLPFEPMPKDWRDVKFSDGVEFPTLTRPIIESLASDRIVTVGDLTTRQKNPRFNLIDVKGIGAKAQKVIDDALIEFHGRRQVTDAKGKPAGPDKNSKPKPQAAA